MVESLREQIKHETELLRLVWVTAVAVAGGALGLVLGNITPFRILLAGLGFLITIIFIAVIIRQETTIRRLLSHMREKEQQE